MEITYLFLCFVIYSFFGWIIEALYRSARTGSLVNAGFLRGCFVPVYGAAALAFLGVDLFSHDWNPAFRFLLYAAMASAVEYGAGILAERILHTRLWNYSKVFGNLQGRIALPFSLIWGCLGILFINVIHPSVWELVHKLMPLSASILAIVFLGYFVVDFTISISLGRRLQIFLQDGKERLTKLQPPEIERLLRDEKRLILAFAHLRQNVAGALNAKFENNTASILNKFKNLTLKEELTPEDLDDREYQECVSDILLDEEFLKTRNFKHHRLSIFDHTLKVSYLAFQIAKAKDWDFRAAARGGLLHDFFLYDWRNANDPGRPTRHLHGIRHPKIALRNAEKFGLSKIERDIIAKHMWPLTLQFPRYKESFLIVFLDKYVASRDILARKSAPIQK